MQCDSTRNLGQGLVEVRCGGLPIVVPHNGNSVQRIVLFPRDIYVSPIEPPGPEVNRFKGVISEIKAVPESIQLAVKAGNNQLVAEMPHHIFESMGMEVGQEIYLILKLRRIRVYEERANL